MQRSKSCVSLQCFEILSFKALPYFQQGHSPELRLLPSARQINLSNRFHQNQCVECLGCLQTREMAWALLARYIMLIPPVPSMVCSLEATHGKGQFSVYGSSAL